MRISDLQVLTINTKYMSERFLQPNRIQLPVKQAKKTAAQIRHGFFNRTDLKHHYGRIDG
ncbi:hypothetical protein CPH39_18465 [Escherichia coli]|uniref:Uncharacterized protein n=1 Tax=Escherichia coli TaxID=562 RepID=A0A8S7CMK3_ECOLX|nr:hypothetical protein [Escherichia coli]EFB2357911.1 hypothetical protein [Escherichia coli]EFC6682952.1 hypothetical protein [Escherichia coli]QHD13526.1 hypothetical protein CPH39_18465 [Escherichia coli]HAG9237159.1 hypothetical protein [Escherichia coli]